MEISLVNTAILVLGLLIVTFTIVSIYSRINIQGVLFDPYEVSKKNLNGYYAIVTGGNSGIGFETGKHLALHGCHVVLACRSSERGIKAANEIEKELNNNTNSNVIYKGGKCEFIESCDLGDLSSVYSFFNQYSNVKQYPCHILVNNAGMGYQKSKFTRKDKFPLVWQVNFLSHFYLTHLLLPLMNKSAKQLNTVSRIINVSSDWHKYGIINFDKYYRGEENEFSLNYTNKKAYGESKLGQIMHATYLQTQLFRKYNMALMAVSLHPGGVYTNIWKMDSRAFYIRLLFQLIYPWIMIAFRNCKQGAQTTLFCAMGEIDTETNDKVAMKTNHGYELVAGAFHINCQPCHTSDKTQQSTNAKEMKKLWQYCHKVLKIQERRFDVQTQTLV